ncbi:hypothetical protein [Janibacter indicus]|uniref:Uncharacterized protein n=1 Tax=Janibacter indicus TaxID=857417 RepID=A0A1W2CED9_9MICO|nr:hypothetical protein [Janibacter indicus]SMC83426.1 hypothetical protein SAMN06296429_11111 [Janibacter indicus]
MDVQQVAGMQAAIVRDAVDQAPSGWTRIQIEVSSLDGVTVFDSLADLPSAPKPVRYFPDEATFLSADLPKAMYQPGKGTWFSMECTVEPSGEYHFTFNYDQPVVFDDREPTDDTWMNDLRRYPRDWDNIPDWHLVKQRYTEDEWLASVQRYKDWLASDDQSPFTG